MDDALPPADTTATADVSDCRLYIPQHDKWQARVKSGWDKFYCYGKNPGEDYHHLILGGEIFLQNEDEVYCLRCALRQGLVTTNRLFWQRGEA